MGKFLVPEKDISHLYLDVNPPFPERRTFEIIDRIIAGAAKETITVPLMILQIDQYSALKAGKDDHTLFKIIEGLFTIIVDQTPDEVFFDILNPNEYILLLPALRVDQVVYVGAEILKRFQKLSKSLFSSEYESCTISGGAASFPEHARNRIELFRFAREAAYEASKRGGNQILSALPKDYATKSAQFSQNQLHLLKHLAKKIGVSDSDLMREALDDYFLKHQ